MTTVALTIPAALLWRQKRAFGLSKHLSSSAPPVRRTVKGVTQRASNASAENVDAFKPKVVTLASSAPPPRRATRRVVVASSAAPAVSSSAIRPGGSANTNLQPSDLSPSPFSDGPLYTLGAFGLATVLVGVGATLGVFGVQRSMGVNNVRFISCLV